MSKELSAHGEFETVEDVKLRMLRWADEDIHEVGRDVLRREAQQFARDFERAFKREIEARSAPRCDKPLTDLDDAIAHCEKCINDTPCGQNHRLLHEWLLELRTRRNCH